MSRTVYTAQFKRKLVLEVLQGEKELGRIAYENNINPNMLRNWKREFLENAGTVFEDRKKTEKQARRKEEQQRKETDKMLKTIGQLTLERDFLQDCFRRCGLPILEPSEEYAGLSVRRQCELLRTSRSQVYYEPKPVDEQEVERRETIMPRIDYWHTQMPYLGNRRITAQLRKEGYIAGRKLIRRYMHEMGIHTIYPKPNLSKRSFKESVVPYLLKDKAVSFPNQVWWIDITYIKIRHSHMYLTAIIDWYSRKIMGWNLSDTLETAPILDTVRQAVELFGVPAILNSDQGSQFTSAEYKALLRLLGIRQSMDGKSRWADNIMIERWFRSLKTELIYTNEFCSPRELRMGIGHYVDDYNTVRPHAALDYAVLDDFFFAAFAHGDNVIAG